jgi:outer membrane protein OmpA-like peptidoglycan-associated protein
LGAEGDWSLINRNSTLVGLGAEYWYQNVVAFRAGYRFENSAALNGVTGLSLGAGARYLNWQLDYALTTIGDFGTSNQITLSLRLGNGPRIRPKPQTVSMRLHQDILPIPLMFESSKPISRWSVEVDNSTGGRVWEREGEGTPPSDLSWDGRDQSGHAVPEGSYLVQATLTDLDGEIERLTLVVVEARFPAVTLPGWKNTYIAQNIDFGSGKDDFTEAEGQTVLTAVQAILKLHPTFLVYIEGHTDSVLSKRGIPNQQLSDERAGALKNYLVKKGIDPNHLDAKGFGDTEPMASNDTLEGQAQNRRVELLLFQK